jgi:hypothetical protein
MLSNAFGARPETRPGASGGVTINFSNDSHPVFDNNIHLRSASLPVDLALVLGF